MDRDATKNGLSAGGRNRLRHAAPPQPQPKDAGKNLVEQFLAELDRSFQEHGHEIFNIVMTTQPKLYFRALVMLALVQHRASYRLSDLDRHRNRAETLLRLQQRAEPAA